MKVILYMAISADGLIAKKGGDSDWVSDVDTFNFVKTINNAGCLVVGRRTFEQYEGDIYPMKDVYNIVLTKNKNKVKKEENVQFTNKSPKDVIKTLKNKGYKQVIVIGGGTLNASFLKENLIDEIILSVHPLILGNGIRLFEKLQTFVNLKLLEVKTLKEGLVHLHYQVNK